MMGKQTVSRDRAQVTGLIAGVLVGAFLGIATSVVFLLIIIGPLLGLGIAVTGLRDGFGGRSRAAAGGGWLFGVVGV